MKVTCGGTDRDDPGDSPNGSGPALMWVRWGIVSPEFGYVDGTCSLWPVGEPLPDNYVEVADDECGAGEAGLSRDDVERMVRSLSASLRVPEPEIELGPEPSVNEWNMSVVGLPIWLWTDVPRAASSTNVGGGMTIQIDAALDRILFDMGDDQRVSCPSWTPYDRAFAGDPSPTCGHAYQWPSLPDGDYTITASAEWTAQWSAMGYSGTLPLRSSATRSIPVGELQAVVVHDR